MPEEGRPRRRITFVQRLIPSRSLVVLLDADDLCCIEAVRPQALDGRVLVFDLDLHLVLLDRGIDHLTPYDLIQPDDWVRIFAFNDDVWQFWASHARVPFEGVDLLNMARYRHRTCLARMAFAAYVIERAIDSLRPDRVIVFEEPTGHGLAQPITYRKMPVLFMLLRGIAEQRAIPIDLIPHESQPGRSPYTDQVAPGGITRLEPIDPSDLFRQKPVILLAGSGVDLVRHLPLIRRLSEQGKYQPVQLYKTATPQQLSDLSACGHPCWHDSQVTHGAPRLESGTFVDDARGSFHAAGEGAPPHLRCIFNNTYLRPHFDFIFGPYLRSMAGHVLSWKHFFQRCRPALLVANYFAPINDVATHMGIPGLALTHALMLMGVNEWFEDFPGFHIGAISAPHKDKLVAAGLPSDHVHVVGDPRIDEILDLLKTDPGLASPSARDRLRADLALSSNQRMILVLISRLATLPHENGLPLTDWADAVRCLDGIADLAARRPHWRWIIKPHPRFDQPEMYERVNKRLPAEHRLRVVRDHGLDDLVQAADVAVVFNLVSSALIEASFRPLPVLMMSQCMTWYSAAQREMQGWSHVSSVLQLEETLQSLFADQHRYQQEVATTQAGLRRYLGGQPTSSLSHCLRTIENIIEGKSASSP